MEAALLPSDGGSSQSEAPTLALRGAMAQSGRTTQPARKQSVGEAGPAQGFSNSSLARIPFNRPVPQATSETAQG